MITPKRNNQIDKRSKKELDSRRTSLVFAKS